MDSNLRLCPQYYGKNSQGMRVSENWEFLRSREKLISRWVRDSQSCIALPDSHYTVLNFVFYPNLEGPERSSLIYMSCGRWISPIFTQIKMPELMWKVSYSSLEYQFIWRNSEDPVIGSFEVWCGFVMSNCVTSLWVPYLREGKLVEIWSSFICIHFWDLFMKKVVSPVQVLS